MLGHEGYLQDNWNASTETSDKYGFSACHGVSPKDTADLLFLGDSYTACSGNDNWVSYLYEHYGYKGYNLGLPATGPWEQYINLVLEYNRLKINKQPLLLWCFFTGNDLDDFYGPTTDIQQLPYSSWSEKTCYHINNFRKQSSVTYLIKRLLISKFNVHSYSKTAEDVLVKDLPNGKQLLFYKRDAQAAKRSEKAVREHPNYAQLLATLKAMKAFTTKHGIRLNILSFPTKEEVYAWAMNDQKSLASPQTPSGFAHVLQQHCDTLGIDFYDLKPHLIEQSEQLFKKSGEILWWYDDTHWNNQGHETVAAYIHQILQAQL